MRALHTVVSSAVVLLLLAVAVEAVEAPAPAMNTAEISAPATAAAEAPAQATQPAQQALSTETQSVHIQVGRSIILNTQARLRRIVVSSPDVLDTATISPTQLVITAKAPGSSSLMLWDESSNARIVDVYADVDVAGLREGIRSAYPNEPVEIEAEQGKILITGNVSSKAVEDNIARLAAVYTKNVVDSMTLQAPPHVKQVMLKVQFIEVDRTKLSQFGINIFSTGATNTTGTITTQQFSPLTLGGGSGGGGGGGGRAEKRRGNSGRADPAGAQRGACQVSGGRRVSSPRGTRGRDWEWHRGHHCLQAVWREAGIRGHDRGERDPAQDRARGQHDRFNQRRDPQWLCNSCPLHPQGGDRNRAE